MSQLNSDNPEQDSVSTTADAGISMTVNPVYSAVPDAEQARPMHESLLRGAGYLFWCALIASSGAVYGVTAYTFFVKFLSVGSGVMLTSFLVGIPLAMGMIVAYLSEKKKMRGVAVASGVSMLALSLFAFAVGALFREGTICLVMAMGLFIPLMLLGALISVIITWLSPNQSGKLSAIVLLIPFAFGGIEQKIEAPTIRQQTQRSVYIEASPEKIWQLINFPLNIRPDELKHGFAYKIGVPYPLEAWTLEARVGGKRQLLWQRGVRFEEEITEWQENRRIAWKYLFTPESFPSGSLDDHVVIGGQYFDIEDTSYTLSPEGSGTRLTVQVGTRVSTHFNWYADFCARYLVGDTAETILNFYKQRAQAS
ncbi:hypothetical protein [Undibacterium sp. Ji22W]|uniref:hypothetical protein n=1 Tax=Undibacterium sp. Ji22W TaxID=3413038 RepID=UPI003BEFFA48